VDPLERALGRILSGAPLETREPFDGNLARRAIAERVAPLVFAKLSRDECLAAAERDALRSELYRAEASNLIAYRELGILLKAAERLGAGPPVLLKGGALASTLYEEVGHRPMGDIDILVPREELGRWLEAGAEASLTRRSPEMSPGLDRSVHYHVALSGKESGAVIEIHYGLIAGEADVRAPDPEWFLGRTEAWGPPPGHTYLARQLDPTAHLLYMCAHAMLQHGGAAAPMIWFYDLHLLIERRFESIDWPELAERARALGWNAALASALCRAHALYGTRVPEAALEGPSEGRGASEVRRRESARTRAAIVWDELRTVGLFRGFLWAIGILFPRPRYMRWRYSAAGRRWPLYYPVRCATALKEGSQALLRRFAAG
jgi:hypothetical protein